MTADPTPHEMVRDARRRLVDYLDDLEPEAWAQPSLCDGWTVTDVVAHLSLSTSGTWSEMIIGMIRHRGSWDRWNASTARRQAETHTRHELIDIIRQNADSLEHAAGSSHDDQLVDLLVHGQDIARAVDTPLSVPVESAVAAIDHVLASRWYGAKQRLADLGLDATDADWSGPGGKAVRGPIVSLLLAASGRPAALADLQGPGIEILRGRLA